MPDAGGARARSEQEAVAFLRTTADDQLAFARRLIATPSPTPPGDERAVARLVRERLVELGVPDITVLSAEPSRPNLMVRVPGHGPGKTLILSGHLDTKPPGDLSRWRVYPYDAAVFGGVLHGLGSGDMKASIAAMVYAGAALARVGGWAGELHLVLTAGRGGGFDPGFEVARRAGSPGRPTPPSSASHAA